MEWASGLIGGVGVLRPYADRLLTRPAQVLLTAVVVMADWIASNTDLFPLRPAHTAADPGRVPDQAETGARLDRAWTLLKLPKRWRPAPERDPAAHFAARFHRPADQLRPVQRAAVELAWAQDEPGLIVIEAPMGEGKTEAALLAAEVLAARSGADGLFVALPTRATSDGMFPRVLDWLAALPEFDAEPSVVLAHGTASLNDHYRGLLRRGYQRFRSIAEDHHPEDHRLERARRDGNRVDGDVGMAHHWLHGRRKGPLAQFVVGTIDQVLFAGLKSRYLMLRHLGLAGKVVLIDEVHAYDVYMSTFLEQVLRWLGAYRTPVVLLSATLPSGRRAALLAAYEDGRGLGPSAVGNFEGYPRVSSTGGACRSVQAAGSPRRVRIDRLPDDPAVILPRITDAVAAGACVAVVHNTVSRVQDTAERLIAALGPDRVTVTHSRFLACDRAVLDRSLLERFGPDGAHRPAGHVVVASQVVEQSLDVDFDLLVTDLAPVDLVLQRIGRLHRHDRSRPAGYNQAACALIGVEAWDAAPIRAVRGSRAVYGEHPLLLSALLLGAREGLVIPTDIPGLVEVGYSGDVPVPATWAVALREAEAQDERTRRTRIAAAEAFLLGPPGAAKETLRGWVYADAGDTEDPRAIGHVRDGGESLEVVVIRRDADGVLTTPPWIPGGATPIPPLLPMEDTLARRIAACALRLPPAMSAMNQVGDDVIKALERNRFDSFHAQPLLRDQLVLVLGPDNTAEVRHGSADFRVTYDETLGCVTSKAEA